MAEKYVVDGAQLECSLGVSSSNLVVLPDRIEKLTGKRMANITDCKPTNIPPFGACKISSPPKPCTPLCLVWLGGRFDHKVQGADALLDSSKVACIAGGGMIGVTDCGQGSTQRGADRVTVDPVAIAMPPPKRPRTLVASPSPTTTPAAPPQIIPTKNLDTVPSIKNGEFESWFDSLTNDEFDKVWANQDLRDAIKDRLRAPGGFHEWLLVSRANIFKKWGVSAKDIRELRTPTSQVKFVKPKGRHGGKGSTAAHNQLLDIIDSSPSYFAYQLELNVWADKRLDGGRNSLPPGLQK